jgi:hypothetical protein
LPFFSRKCFKRENKVRLFSGKDSNYGAENFFVDFEKVFGQTEMQEH